MVGARCEHRCTARHPLDAWRNLVVPIRCMLIDWLASCIHWLQQAALVP